MALSGSGDSKHLPKGSNFRERCTYRGSGSGNTESSPPESELQGHPACRHTGRRHRAANVWRRPPAPGVCDSLLFWVLPSLGLQFILHGGTAVPARTCISHLLTPLLEKVTASGSLLPSR